MVTFMLHFRQLVGALIIIRKGNEIGLQRCTTWQRGWAEISFSWSLISLKMLLLFFSVFNSVLLIFKQRRRDKIKGKLKALQDLIPNSHKVNFVAYSPWTTRTITKGNRTMGLGIWQQSSWCTFPDLAFVKFLMVKREVYYTCNSKSTQLRFHCLLLVWYIRLIVMYLYIVFLPLFFHSQSYWLCHVIASVINHLIDSSVRLCSNSILFLVISLIW